MPVPDFSPGEILTAAAMDSIGLWRVTGCTVSSAGGTAATASNGVITVGTGNTSVTVSAAFNSSFDNYKIVYDGGVASTTLTLALTLGASVTTYNMALPYVTYGAAVASGTSLINSTSWALAGYGTANYVGMSMDLFSPNLARYTRIAGSYLAENEAGGYFGIHKTATAYTAFTLAVSTGTITGGTIRVYGYNK